MEELIEKLNEAAKAYYNGEEIMSNFEYDKLYDALVVLEEQAGYSLPGSPTQKVGASVVDSLPKQKHEVPALSLAKTKDVDAFCESFAKYISSDEHIKVYNRTLSMFVTLMWKMDGSTIVCTYDNGHLVSCVTRGDGETGSVILHNAPYIHGIPLEIDYKKHLVVRGEAVMSYPEFLRINQLLPEEEQYKNPRNLANATISLLDSKEMRKRKIDFKAFELVTEGTPQDLPAFFSERLKFLKKLGFDVVDFTAVHYRNLKTTMEEWSDKAKNYDYPVDGLVCCMDECAFTASLKGTNHNPHIMKGYAFKWADETEETVLRDIEWSASRTGLLNPVAVFDPVELEGTTVSRASLHNVSYIWDMNLDIGDRITIYKANKIIPQVAENLDKEKHPRKNMDDVVCPCCGAKASLVTGTMADKGLKAKCPNPDCPAKNVGKFVHFCERDCMNIVGMSEAIIGKLVEAGILKEYADFFRLEQHPEIAQMEGFGEKSWKNMIAAAETARVHCTFVGLLHSMGIPNVGKGQAKLLKTALEQWTEEYYPDFEMSYIDAMTRKMDMEGFTNIEGFGNVISSSLEEWCQKNIQTGTSFMNLFSILPPLWIPKKESEEKPENNKITGKTFVITGSVEHFANREEFKTWIEKNGGKCTGSVTSKTDYLINNDITSTSGKNKKAKELGIPILSEEEVLQMAKE